MNGLNTQHGTNQEAKLVTSERIDTGGRRIDGWKEIGSYLGRSARCAQRWERNLGLPVHRIRHTDGYTVYAYAEELELWRQSRDEMPAPVASDTPTASETAQPPYRLAAASKRWNRSVFELCRLVLKAVPARIERS